MRDGRDRHLANPAWALLAALWFWAAPASHAAPAGTDPAWSYRVQPGDNLFDLTNDYLKDKASWRELQRLNHVADPLKLQPGTTLSMPIRLLRREAGVASAVFVQGEVMLLRASSPPTPLQAGAELHSGDELRTGAQGSLTLRFVDGSRMLLEPGTVVTLEQLLIYGRSAIPAMQMRLQQGGAENKVHPSSQRPPVYELRTPSLNLGVRGTEFRVQVSDDGRATRAEVLEGVVAAGDARLAAGYGMAAASGQGSSPATRLLPAPDLGSTAKKLERIPLSITWTALEGARAYRVQVFADGDFEHLLLDGRFESPRAQWADLPDGRYNLRVRGIDALGLEGLAADMPIVLKARPEPPFASAPPLEANVYGDSATLAWTRPVNAVAFRLQVADDASFTPPLRVDRSDLGATELTLPLPPGHYFWRLASIAQGEDQGPFGDPQSFTQRPIPPTPALSPPEVGDKELRFRWAAAPGAAGYQLQWSTDPEFKTLLAEPKTEQPELVLPRPPHGIYYVRVKSVDALGYAGPYGTAQKIELPRPLWPWLVPLGVLLLFKI